MSLLLLSKCLCLDALEKKSDCMGQMSEISTCFDVMSSFSCSPACTSSPWFCVCPVTVCSFFPSSELLYSFRCALDQLLLNPPRLQHPITAEGARWISHLGPIHPLHHKPFTLPHCDEHSRHHHHQSCDYVLQQEDEICFVRGVRCGGGGGGACVSFSLSVGACPAVTVASFQSSPYRRWRTRRRQVGASLPLRWTAS